MNILLIGAGGREHALAWKMSASPLVDKLWCAPGNAGIAQEAEIAAIDITDHKVVAAFCKANAVDFVVVGPEAPMVAGIVDDLEAAGIKTFGASRAAARLEGSKAFTKALCLENEIPTAYGEEFKSKEEAEAYVYKNNSPLVVKVDGLAAGKGVVVPSTVGATISAIEAVYRDIGGPIVLEEILHGEEVSFFALCDGETAIPLTAAQDHKRAFDGDQGPNTGGMGAFSPVFIMDDVLAHRTMDEIILPTLRAMKAAGTPFKGVLYAGLMITPTGPKLIEYNVRFGDPECQVLMLRLKSDLVPALMAARDGMLKNFDLRWSSEAAVTVVMASRGYPGSYAKGAPIGGLEDAAAIEGVEVFHAGTALRDGRIVADGGRVLNVCALAPTVEEARRRAYAAVDRIQFPGGFCRRDIASRAIGREVVTTP